MSVLLDTHFLLWTVLDSPRLAAFPWLERHRPFDVSPVSFLEIAFLAEVGRVEVRNPEFTDAVLADPRFRVDEAPLLALVRAAATLRFTRDPFDRLLAAHSRVRRIDLCTVDRQLLRHHRYLPRELRGAGEAGA